MLQTERVQERLEQCHPLTVRQRVRCTAGGAMTGGPKTFLSGVHANAGIGFISKSIAYVMS